MTTTDPLAGLPQPVVDAARRLMAKTGFRVGGHDIRPVADGTHYTLHMLSGSQPAGDFDVFLKKEN